MNQFKGRFYETINAFEGHTVESDEEYGFDSHIVRTGTFPLADLEIGKGKTWKGVRDPVYFRVGNSNYYFVDRETFLNSTRLAKPQEN